MQEKRFRNQVTWILFLLSILVIWVHSYNAELFAGEDWGAVWEKVSGIERFVSVGIGQIAVPGFFMMSSYLFFRNFEMRKLLQKWKSRFFSVAVPYAAWTAFYYLGYAAATRLPVISQVIGREPVPFNIEEMVHAVCEYRYAPIFWYLYQLIFLILLSPVVYMAVKNKIIGIAYLSALLMAVHLRLDLAHPNTDALFYYSAAAYMAVHGRSVTESHGTYKRLRLVTAIMVLTIFCYSRMQTAGADVLWTVLYRSFAPVVLWIFLSCIELPEARPWMRQSMFLYAVHFMIVRFVNKGAAILFRNLAPESVCRVGALLIYFVLPVIVTAVSYFMARLLVRYCPVLWRILSGGRKLEEKA